MLITIIHKTLSVVECSESLGTQIRRYSLQSLLVASVVNQSLDSTVTEGCVFIFHRTSECMRSSELSVVFWWTHECATLPSIPLYLISTKDWAVSMNFRLCISHIPLKNNFLEYKCHEQEKKGTISFAHLPLLSSPAEDAHYPLTVKSSVWVTNVHQMFLVLSQTLSAVQKTFMSWTKLSTLEMEQRWTVTERETGWATGWSQVSC